MRIPPRKPFRVIPILAIAALAACACVCATGCSSLSNAATALPVVDAAIADSELALQAVQSSVDAYFASTPNATLQSQLDKALADATTALRAGSAAVAGVTSLTQAAWTTAFADFGTAWTNLMTLCSQIGIQPTSTAARGTVKLANGTSVVLVSVPAVLTTKVQ